ncbi:hypothetical protein BCR35DRAFT_181744 [Leucosporidium creatinivorum]|uniref:Uncharacterized protein n=1 Tax=Leucosporidium creatinivorum TaxID=106004 RepID=A0A1Y2E5G1_9BASI|nr:hypothetical protein BCR35DRAFT_181744 [Leucosporidium creatinivorum]
MMVEQLRTLLKLCSGPALLNLMWPVPTLRSPFALGSPSPSRLILVSPSMAHSRESSTSDLHVYSNTSPSYSYGPPPSSSFSDTGSEPPSRRTSLAYDLPTSAPSGATAGHRPTPSIASTGASAGPGARRSRARAFSFLLDNSPQVLPSLTPSPGGRRTSISTLDDRSDLPFGGDAYDFALRAEEEDDEDVEAVEFTSSSGGGGEAQQRRAYRQTFQPIVKEELWWMGVSAATVLGLTATAVVLSVVG